LSSRRIFLFQMKTLQSNKSVLPPAWLLGGILVFLVLCVQLPGILRPFGGHFASYQSSVMGAISRNMFEEKFSDVLIPKMDLLVGGEKARHLNQYPFPSLAAALAKFLLGGSFEFWGRVQAIFCNLISVLLCGLIGARLLGTRQGWLAAYLYGLSPFSLIYGQAFMSEAMALSGLLGAYYFYLRADLGDRWNYKRLLLSGLLLSFAITGRIHLIVAGPIFAVDILRRPQRWRAAAFFGVASLCLPILWYGFTYFASVNSEHVITNIFIQKAARPINAIVDYFSPGFLLRMTETMGERLMTPLAWPLFAMGAWAFRSRGFPAWIILGSVAMQMLLCMLLPQKVSAHEFYLIGLTPFLAMGAAEGLTFLSTKFPLMKRSSFAVAFILFYFLISMRYSFGPIFKNQNDIEQILTATRFVESNTDSRAKLIIFGSGLAVAAYYADRPCLTMEPEALGGELSYYLKNSQFAKVDLAEVAREELAMKDFVSWFEYLRGRGAAYFLAFKRGELESRTNLLKHLNRTAERVSPADADFYLFKLQNGENA